MWVQLFLVWTIILVQSCFGMFPSTLMHRLCVWFHFSRSRNAFRRNWGEHRENFSKFRGTKGEITLCAHDNVWLLLLYYTRILKNNGCPLFSSFLLDRLLQYERVDEDSSGIFFFLDSSFRIKCLYLWSASMSMIRVVLLTALLVQVSLSFPDSDATVSSDNSEGEGPREREREREVVKKYVFT